MRNLYPRILLGVLACYAAVFDGAVRATAATAPLGGFIPFVAIGLTKEFETFDTDPTGAFYLADPSYSWGSPPLGPGSSTFFDIALLDTGAGAHILTPQAAGANGFAIQAEGLKGTTSVPIFGATGGQIDMLVNDPLGIYATSLADRNSEGATLVMKTDNMRGQTSVATLEAPSTWTLPNILGLPMAAQHGIVIRNDQPQIFQYQNRTVRSPNVSFIDLGDGDEQGIQRRTNLRIRPSSSFLSGPLYVQNLTDIFNGHNNPSSPTVVQDGAMYLEVDVMHKGETSQNLEFLFDTGADMTVVSEVFAASLGFDVLRDTPDFVLEVEGAGGVASGVKGFYADQLKIDAVGGSLVLEHVPIAVLDVPNPLDAANVLDAIIGTHVFTGRNLVIDAIPAAFAGGGGPRLYISDPVSQAHQWTTAAASANWAAPGSWSAATPPEKLWDVQAINATNPSQTAVVSADSTVYRMTVGGHAESAMTVAVQSGATLTTFGEALIQSGGRVNLQGGKLDAQFINIESGGRLAGNGQVFVGAGPVQGAIRNLGGRVEPGGNASTVGELSITGDLANINEGVLAFDLAGTGAGQFDKINISRLAFLGGTLEVSLASFSPSVGNSFTLISATQGVEGQFENLVLPAGYVWNVAYQPKAVVLSVTGIGSLPGDFNNTGAVNGADLVAWNNGFGTTYNGGDFLTWQRHFTGGGAANGVPEPAGAALAIMAMAVAAAKARLRRHSAPSGR